MSGTPSKAQGGRRKLQLPPLLVPGDALDLAPDRNEEPRLHARRSSVVSVALGGQSHVARRGRQLCTLCGALLLALLLVLRVLFVMARSRPPLPTFGLPLADAQRCCGAEPCKRPFVAPIVKASAQDTAVLEALACAWLPDVGGFQVTMVWSNEHMPRSRFSVGVKDKLYKAMRLLRYGRLRDIESFVVFPGPGTPDGPPVDGVWFPGTFSHTSTFAVNKHFSARIPGALISLERGRPVVYSRTWNHLSHFRPEAGPGGTPLAHVTYDTLACVPASRAAVEQRFSVLLPWKAAESGGARKSFAHTILFDPPELSTDEVLDESEQAAAADGGGGGVEGQLPRRAGGDAGPPPGRRRRGARVRSFGARLHRWLWGLMR